MIMPLFQRLAVNGNCFCDIVICDRSREEVLFVEQKFVLEDEVTFLGELPQERCYRHYLMVSHALSFCAFLVHFNTL